MNQNINFPDFVCKQQADDFDIYQYEGFIYARRGSGKKMYFAPIADFTVMGYDEFIRLDSGDEPDQSSFKEMIIFTNCRGAELRFERQELDFTNLRKFRVMLETHGSFMFTGNAKDLKRLEAHCQSELDNRLPT
jgi:hypothetical protein